MGILACNGQKFILNLSNSKTRSNFLKLFRPQVNFISSATTLTLKMAHSHSSQNPGIEQQRVIIPNKHGEKLVGLLHETGSKGIVVLCHGVGATKDHPIMVNLAVALEKEGISAFRFDFAGIGESEGSSGFGNIIQEVDDLHAVIQHFCGANRKVTAILGHSKGGLVVLLYASKYHDIHTVINVCSRYDFKKGLEGPFGKDFMDRFKKDGFIDVKNPTGEYRVTLESVMDLLSINMHEECLKIPRECRVLTIHGSADEITPVEDAFEFAKVIPNHKLHIVEGADHFYTSHQTELASLVLSFLKQD